MAIGIGLGLALFPIHNPNQPLKQYLFLPTVGLSILILCAALYLFKTKKIELGDKFIYIPMFLIIASSVARLIVYRSSGELSGALFLGAMFCLYLATRKIGASVFKVLLPFVIVEAISVIWLGITAPNIQTGGLLFYKNYDIAIGFMVFGAIVNQGKYQWALLALVAIASYFTGGYEAGVILPILAIAILARRDWNKKAFIIAAAGAIVLAVLFFSGNIGGLWVNQINNRTIAGQNEVVGMETALTGRWDVIINALKNTSVLGHGLAITDFNNDTVHNVPLIILDQIGIVAAIAWAFVSFRLLLKTKWKYAWIALLAMGIFDHYTWTQLAPAWWLLAGVSSTSKIENDRVFA